MAQVLIPEKSLWRRPACYALSNTFVTNIKFIIIYLSCFDDFNKKSFEKQTMLLLNTRCTSTCICFWHIKTNSFISTDVTCVITSSNTYMSTNMCMIHIWYSISFISNIAQHNYYSLPFGLSFYDPRWPQVSAVCLMILFQKKLAAYCTKLRQHLVFRAGQGWCYFVYR